MKEKICRIICAGKNYNYNFNFNEEDYIIAVDGGYKYLKDENIKPNLVIGDYDSLGYIPKDENFIKLNVEKDETDTYFAVKKAIEMGFNKLYIYCGTGGEIDHTLGNIQTLIYIAKQHKIGYLFDDKKVMFALENGKVEFNCNSKGIISILSCSNICEGVTIKGLLYEADNINLTNEFPLGLRNSFKNVKSEIAVKNGCLLIVIDKDEILKII